MKKKQKATPTDAMHEWEADNNEVNSPAECAREGGQSGVKRPGEDVPAPDANELEKVAREVGSNVSYEVTGHRRAGKLPPV